MCSKADKTTHCAAPTQRTSTTAKLTKFSYEVTPNTTAIANRNTEIATTKDQRTRLQFAPVAVTSVSIIANASLATCVHCYQQLLFTIGGYVPSSQPQSSAHVKATKTVTITHNCRPNLLRCITLIAISLLFWSNANAAPQSCILCDKEDLKAKDPSNSYEEFLFEHQVTRQDAVNALKGLNESFYMGPSPDNSCKSVTCTKKVMKYCLGPQFINDHCWCELGHTEEGLPFVPHICYVGEKVYTASVGSCFFYEEVKECCCASALAKQWRHISGTSSQYKQPLNLSLVSTMLLLFLAVSLQ